MSWTDFFLPDGAQTASEQEANIKRQQAELQRRMDERRAAGTLSDEQYYNDFWLVTQQPTASTDGVGTAFVEGAKEGWNNVLDAPGNVVDAVGQSASRSLWGIIKGVPLWVWPLAIIVLFIWMGGLALLRGKLAKYA